MTTQGHQEDHSPLLRQLQRGVGETIGTTKLSDLSPLPLGLGAQMKELGLLSNTLPIQAFKLRSEELKVPASVRRFRSSGTTSSKRSLSSFSEAGLQTYRDASLLHFYESIRHFFPEPISAQGISLIPTVDEWPDSSLAQMIGWIAKHSSVQYVSKLNEVPSKPCWIFGTGFHFVHLHDQGLRIPLAPGSIVIETGGTKGRSRYVNSQQLHEMIRTVFSIDAEHIVSEYGMCELASQAYKVDQSGFRFPYWVDTYITDGKHLETKGEGCLVVHDRARIDYPWPIQTQDLVRLAHDGSFELKGRVPGSTLKGCSLNAEGLLRPGTPADHGLTHPRFTTNRIRTSSAHEGLIERLERFIASENFSQALADEFGSKKIAEWAQADLLAELPSASAWHEIIARHERQQGFQRWLYIPAQSHAVALIYPLAMATALGLSLGVRRRHKESAADHAIYSFFKGEGLDLCLVADSYRISGPIDNWQALLLNGQRETIDTISKLAELPVCGQGEIIGVYADSLDSFVTDAAKVQKDLLSLAQLGCLSTRTLFLVSDLPAQDFQDLFTKAYEKSAANALSPSQKIGTQQKQLEAALMGVTLQRMRDGCLVNWKAFDGGTTFEEYLQESQFSFAVVQVASDSLGQLRQLLASSPAIRVSGHLDLASSQIEPGKGNQSPWESYHFQQEIYTICH